MEEVEEEFLTEPGDVESEELERIIREGISQCPLKVRKEEINEEIPGDLKMSESGKLLKQYITWEGFGDHHIEVYDNWISRSSYHNVYGRMLQFKDGRVVCFENLKVLQPKYTRDGKVLPLTPKLAREQGVTYGSDWHVDVVLRRGSCDGEELDRRSSICIGTVPVMLKSRNCFLHGKTPRELAIMGEDPKDPGGYFIIEGVEKVILLQEQLAVNRIFLMNMDTKGSTVARMTANTIKGTALIELALDKKTRTIMKIRFPSMRGSKQGEKYKSINVLRIFRLFGQSDPVKIQNIIALFMKPEHVKKSMLKLTRNLVDFIMFPDDIEIMAAKMEKSKLTHEEKVMEIRRVLDIDLFPHLNNFPGPDNETVAEREVRIGTAKIYLLAIMIARFLEHIAGYRELDDRDSWSNKRVEGSGRMMEQLFRNAWRKTLGLVQNSIEDGAIKDLSGVVEKIRYSVITDTFRDSFITSNWGVKGQQMKNNVAQTLVRDSVVATFAHINTVDVGISRTDRQPSLRLVQNSQWGYIDSVSTPEGENCLALGTLVLRADGTYVDIGKVKDGDMMLTLNPQTYEIKESPVYKCFTRTSQEHGKQVYNIRTLDGKSVIATGDHPFLTANGFVKASDLKPLCDHLCISYVPTQYSNHCEKVIPLLDSDNFINKLSKYGLREETIMNYRDDLDSKGLINLMNNDTRVPIISRMIGFLTADGNITIKNGYPALTGYFGCNEDAEEFRKDADKLGFHMQPATYSEYDMEEAETERKITHHIYRTEYTGSLVALFLYFDVVPGRKTTQNSSMYPWLDNVSKLSRREFLSGLMGGDGGAVRVARGSSYRITHFTQSKRPGYLESGHEFMNMVTDLLSDFDVKVCAVREEKYKQGISLRMDFGQNTNNILNYVYNIGFRYCKEKLTNSLRVSEFLLYRNAVIDDKLKRRKRIIELHNQGMKPKEISEHLCYSYTEVRGILSHKGEEPGRKIPKDALTYEQWCDCTHAINGCIYVPIQSITPAPDCSVCDYTTASDDHTIICANGIVSHNCGILKNLSITAKVSLERSDNEIIRLLIGDEERGIERRVSDNLSVRNVWSDKIIVNGKFLGWCNGEETRQFLIQQRRDCTLPYDMSVIKEDDWLYVDIGPSRLVRPLLVVDPDQQLAIDRLNLRGADSQTLLSSGAMEYISSWEQEYIKIAVTVDDIRRRLEIIEDASETYRVAQLQFAAVQRGEKIPIEVDGVKVDMSLEEAEIRLESAREGLERAQKNQPYTHCELDPQAILGIAASLIPFINHNQAPRNTYQVSMGKQALGIYHNNHLNRMTDGKTKILAFPSRPIVETEMYNVIGLDKRGPGENVTIAFMAFPYTEEDSFVFKKEFLDNGGFRIYKYLTYKTIVKHSGEVIEKLTRPEPREGEPPGRYKYIQMGDADSPINGLPMIGAPLRQGDCVIGKIQYIPGTKEIRNESVILRVGDEGVVDKVQVTSDNKTTVVIVKLRTMRVPQEGDKFAPRNAQKGTIGLVMSEIDMPVSESGIVPDIVVNTHCFTADTPVLLKNGMSRPLISMKYDGGDKVWSWDHDKFAFIESSSMGYESKGIRDVMKLTLSDGRIIKCTPDHKIPVLELNGSSYVSKIVKFNEITSSMKFMAGIEGPLDNPSKEDREKELLWNLSAGAHCFSMVDSEDRDKSLAFARLLGIICADGCICLTNRDKLAGNIVIGTHIDADTVLDDIELICNVRPAVTNNYSVKAGNTLVIMLPQCLLYTLSELDGMTIGRRTIQIPELPKFLFDSLCPKSIIREFLGGLFGGDGWSPYLISNKQDGQGTVIFKPPAISQSSIPENSHHLIEKMNDIANLLERVGVAGARVDNPKIYNHGNKDMITCVLQLPRGTEFGDKVGFRYCVQKMYRMAAYQSYMRYLDNVKRQNDYVIRRASEIYDAKEVGNSLERALVKARQELFANEVPFNEYYSNGTLDQVRNRRRADRFKELVKWDYSRIEDADKYLHKIGAYHWFRTDEGTGGADFIIKQDDKQMPYFLLNFHDKRIIGKEEVFDIGIWKTHTLSASGIAINQCIPSRMTISYLYELLGAKHGAMRGVNVNASAFVPPAFNEWRETMKYYNMNEFGYEKMRSGTSGKPLEALIFMGPVYFQALKHHVKDKAQVRSTGQVKPMTRQPPKGKIIARVVSKITASLCHKRQHNQIQGKSQIDLIHIISTKIKIIAIMSAEPFEQEKWDNVNISEYKNYYLVSSLGNVWSIKRNISMKQQMRGGYLTVTLCVDRIKKTIPIHRLVALTFLQPIDGYDIVNHKDGNRINNNINNLEWTTLSGNAKHAVDTLKIKRLKVGVIQYDLAGNYIATYNSVKEAAKAVKTTTKSFQRLPKSYLWERIKPKIEDIAPEGVEHPDYPGYIITRDGKIYSCKTNKYLVQKLHPSGYYRVNLSRGKLIDIGVHTLVAGAYLEKGPGKDQVNHIDRNTTNNNVNNLEWVSGAENMQHVIATDTSHLNKKSVIQCDTNGNKIRIFESIKQASKAVNLSSTTISSACKENRCSGGFLWKFNV